MLAHATKAGVDKARGKKIWECPYCGEKFHTYKYGTFGCPRCARTFQCGSSEKILAQGTYESLMTLGTKFIQENEWQKALEVFDNMIKNHQLKMSDTAYSLYGSCLFRNGMYEEANKMLESSLKINPNNVDAYIILGSSCLKIENYRECEKVCRNGLAEKPNSAELHFILGAALYFLGELDEAESEITIGMNIDPNKSYDKLLRKIINEKKEKNSVKHKSKHDNKDVSFEELMDGLDEIGKELDKLDELDED